MVELEKGARPIFKRPYPIPEAFREAVNNRCQEWLDNGWVKLLPPDQRNDWNSPLLAVKKVSGNKWLGDIRLCMDFRWVNALTLDPAFMIPLCREMLEKLVGMRIFSELDLVNAYHQVPLSKESMMCTGFTIPGKGQAVWTVLFFGTKGAVTFFQKVIELALGNLTGSMVIVIYVDNILVGSLEVESHVRELVKVIEALTSAGLKLKPAKCKFGYEAIGFMGAILSGEKRGVDPYKAKVFSEMLRPRGGKEVQSVLGFANFLQDFIPLYANIVGPLEKLRAVKKISEEDWESSGGKKAFETLKEVLSNTPVLHNLDWAEPFFLETDASQYGVGAVLFQKGKDGGERYIDFAAKAFNKAQQNYSAGKRELLAGMFAMTRWRSWLLFRKFYWGMDNKALTFINGSTNRMILDWVNYFQDFNFETRFKRGILNVLPHELSHMYDLVGLDFGKGEEGVWGGEKRGEEFGQLVGAIQGVGTGFAKSSRKFLQEKLERVAPPAGKELELVKERHRESHMGEKMLFEMLWADRFWWETMWRDCKRVAKGCIDCLRHNVGRAGFHPMSTVKADRPWDHIAMDFIGKLPASEKGFVFILIIVDVLTRFVVLRPLMRKDAKTVALELVNLFANFGVAKIIQSDNESTFVSELLEELRGLMGFKARRVMKYFPRQNGLVESYVGEVKRVMKKWLEGDPSGWEGFIPAIQMGLNDRVISRHGSRPFSLMFGRRMNAFEDYEEMGDDERGEANVKAWAGSVEQLGQFVWDTIEEKGGEVGEGFVRDGNKRGESVVRRSELKVGDLVLRKIQRPKKGQLDETWEGPFKVMEVDEEVGGYKLREAGDKRVVDGLVPIEHLRLVEEVLDESEEVTYEVEKILDHRGGTHERLYKVKWKGHKTVTWEPPSNFNSKECIQDYWRMREKGKGRAVPARRSSRGAAANTANGSPSSSSSSGL